MNGRIYDPTLGRFLQADPFIQALNNSQSYNRYSYVLNNPLSYTDPSGYNFKKLLKAQMKFDGSWNLHKSINSHAPWLNGVISTGLNFVPYCQIWCSALWNANANFVATGSLSSAYSAGATTAATAFAFQAIGSYFDGLDGVNKGTYNFGGNSLTGGEVAQQIAAHAIVGGISAELQGGKFGHGFFSAGFTKGFGGAFLPGGSNLTTGEIIQGTIVSAIIGGTTSKISGGKFSNGAQTSAFQFLFNQVGKSISSDDEPIISEDDARTLAKHGITAIKVGGKYVFKNATGETILKSLTKSGAGALISSLSLLDTDVAFGVLRLQTRTNIDRFQRDTSFSHLDSVIEMRSMLSSGNHASVVIRMAEHNYRYKSLDELLD